MKLARDELPHAILEVQPEGFVLSDQIGTVPQTKELADLLMKRTRALCDGPAAVLVLLNGQPCSQAARRRIASADEVAVVAMVISSTVGTILVNFFLRVNKPKYPFRVFTDQGKAREWLVAESQRLRG